MKEKNNVETQKTFKEKVINLFKKFGNHLKKYKQPYLIGVGFVLWFSLMLFLAMFRQTLPYNPVAIDFGFASIAWYAVFILSGAIFAIILAYREAFFLDMNRDHLIDAALIGIIVGVVGARLYYIAFNPVDSFLEIFALKDGGLAIHGAVLVSLIFAYIYTKIRGMDLLALLDVVAVGFLIAQVVGRWGNFMNQEAHGGPMGPTAINFLSKVLPNFIFENMKIGGIYHHPTFLYEGIWNFVGFIILLIIRRKRLFKMGDMIGLYLIWYGLGRGLLIEPFRTDPLLFFRNADPANFILNMLNRVNVVLSLTLFTVGGVSYIIVKNKLKPELPYYLDVVNENKEEALYLLSREGRKERKEIKRGNKKWFMIY